jgi:hypothetical protein
MMLLRVSLSPKSQRLEYGPSVNTSLHDASDGRSEVRKPALAPLRPVANRCNSGNCPTVYMSGAGTLVVQGYAVSAERADVDLPDGESLVEIPLDLLTEALRNLAAPD